MIISIEFVVDGLDIEIPKASIEKRKNECLELEGKYWMCVYDVDIYRVDRLASLPIKK